jgi:hypothetical protein
VPARVIDDRRREDETELGRIASVGRFFANISVRLVRREHMWNGGHFRAFLDCGLRIADCGLRIGLRIDWESAINRIPHCEIRNPLSPSAGDAGDDRLYPAVALVLLLI